MSEDFAGILMAGGRGTRMNCSDEKPLIPLNGKPMIKHVIDTLSKLDKIGKTVVVVSPNTPKTAEYVRRLPVKVVETPGEGYCLDMKTAMVEVGCDVGLIVPSDLPFLTRETLEEVLTEYNKNEDPALSVFVPLSLVEDMDVTPDMEYRVNGELVVPAGVNIVKNCDVGNSRIDQTDLVLSSEDLALNINDRDSLRVAKEMLSEGGSE